MPIKKVKLKKIPIVKSIPPAASLQVPSSEMEKLYRSIHEKCEQNTNMRNKVLSKRNLDIKVK